MDEIKRIARLITEDPDIENSEKYYKKSKAYGDRYPSHEMADDIIRNFIRASRPEGWQDRRKKRAIRKTEREESYSILERRLPKLVNKLSSGDDEAKLRIAQWIDKQEPIMNRKQLYSFLLSLEDFATTI